MVCHDPVYRIVVCDGYAVVGQVTLMEMEGYPPGHATYTGHDECYSYQLMIIWTEDGIDGALGEYPEACGWCTQTVLTSGVLD